MREAFGLREAVVLAAGKGERLQPFTSTRPKHLIPVAGKPLLHRLLDSLRVSGVRRAVLVVNHLEEQIRRYFGDGSALGIEIAYVRQKAADGTARAVCAAEGLISEDEFLLVYGDLLLSLGEIQRVLERHAQTGLPTISAAPVDSPGRYGVIEVENGLLKRIVEKPEKGETSSNLANAGVYVFNADIFDLARQTRVSKRGEYEITDTMQAMIRLEHSIAFVRLDQEGWMDIGRPWDLLEANERILKKEQSSIEGEIEKGANIVGPLRLEKGARIRSGSYIEGPAYVGKEADVGPNCYIRPYTCLGNRTRVGNACEVKNSLIMEGTHVAHLSYIGDTVIGESCNLGAGTITGNLRLDDATVKVSIKDELTDSGRRKLGAFIGDGVKTAINVSLMPGVKIGANAWIGPNTVIYRDVLSGSFMTTSQESETRSKPVTYQK